MKIKQNGSWVIPPEGVQWKQDGVWRQGEIEWVQLGDEDFSKTVAGQLRYIGTYPYVILPDVIQGVSVNSYAEMFYGTSVRGVKSTNKNVTNMRSMFLNTQATSLDLRNLDTSNVTNMTSMFRGSQATSLDLSNFDTSNVTDMNQMFHGSQATRLVLSSFDTSNVTDMGAMFHSTQATSLDLSNFDTSSVTSMASMFNGSQATILDLSSFDASNVTSVHSMFAGSPATIGYARTQADADKFNASIFKPARLNFVVKL